ncbi:KOW domain-containing RNA-binding protein [Lachnoclostridium sp. An181]|uniref:KOW domain-containing RNA-binding protein n=1 Tax=Lachnoclostridium sp. An181 TaxID=1965575 RepID=UPI000B3AA517|nr:KOW domain-containing RNA-binding protein [Lachnoclostridium sp. An181]OUP48931.1 RNA-binding protein [Lachnoclostridium sp. An181]
MTEWKMGMLAKSKAGHDKNNVYIVIGEEDRYVYLADGEVRTWEKPKKKKKKHVQPIGRYYELEESDNVKLKRILKLYKKEKLI